MEKMRVRKVVRNKIFIDIWKFLGIVWLNIVLKRFQNLKNVKRNVGSYVGSNI